MIIELSYWDMFWAGVTVGWILCVPVILSVVNFKPIVTEERQEMYDMKTLGYLPVPEFKQQPTQYFKYVPVKELRVGNQREIPSGWGENDYEAGECLTCLKLYAREKNGKGSSHCDLCIKINKVKSDPPLPEYNPNK